MMMVISLAHYPEYLETYTSGRYFSHISVYCSYLNHVQKLFEDGRDKTTVLGALINMHRPKAFWEAQAKAQSLADASKKKEEGEQTHSGG